MMDIDIALRVEKQPQWTSLLQSEQEASFPIKSFPQHFHATYDAPY